MREMIVAPRILRAHMNESWTIEGALSELIDNSFGEARGNARNVWIDWDMKERVLKVTDDGVGMTNVGHLFDLGVGIELASTENDPGFYGFGGSKALLNMAVSARVRTIHNGRYADSGLVEWEKSIAKNIWPVIEDRWRDVRFGGCPEKLRALSHGTQIEMQVQPKRNFREDLIRKQLGRTYSAGLCTNRSIFWNGVAIEAWQPPNLQDITEFTLDFGADLKAKCAVGWSDEIPLKDSVISIAFGFRQVMETREPFGKYGGGKIYGIVNLSSGWRPFLTTEKDDIDVAPLKNRLISNIAEKIAFIIQFLDESAIEDLFLSVDLQLEKMLEPIRRAAFPNTTGWVDHVPPRPRKKGPPKLPPDDKDPGNGVRNRDKLAIRLDRVSEIELAGRVAEVELRISQRVIIVRLNTDVADVINAFKDKPVNKRLLIEIIAHHASIPVIEQNLLSTVFTEKELEELHDRTGGNKLLQVAYVSRRFMDRVSPVSESKNL